MGTKLSHPGFCLCLCWGGHLPRGPLCVSKQSPHVHRYTCTWRALHACVCFLRAHFLTAQRQACPLFACCSSYSIAGLCDGAALHRMQPWSRVLLSGSFFRFQYLLGIKFLEVELAGSKRICAFHFDGYCQFALWRKILPIYLPCQFTKLQCLFKRMDCSYLFIYF